MSISAITPQFQSATREVLKRYWGFDELRPLQGASIDATLARRDSLTVLPTGGGKSLCYQLPPIVTESLTLVVSPLIALMEDQVASLTVAGINAGAMHSNLSADDSDELRQSIARGELRLLFVAPERLMNGRFLSWICKLNLAAIAIDEAHCISQWGHDFRPEYRRLRELRDILPGVPIGAYTATATPKVRQDIIEQLRLESPEVLVGNFDRPNLTYRILPRVNALAQTAEVIARHKGQASIVYCMSRRDTEETAEGLRSVGLHAAAYHAGMTGPKRTKVADAFRSEELDIVVATVAFGMGIDRGDVRAVVHTAMPKSIEAYQQETGRAGRDGLPAECVLLYSAGDLMRWKRLIESPDRFTQQRQDESGELPSVDPQAAIALQLELLDTMQRFAGGTRCRHKHLCGYFGQELETDAVSGCGACDACLGDMEAVPDAHDIARKIISCVARINKSGPAMGAKHTIEVLRGAHTEGITRRGHDKLPTHGLLRQVPVERLRSYIDQLIDQSGLIRSGTEYPVLDLGDQALPILRNETTAVLVEPRQIDDSRRTQRDYTGKAEVSLTPAERDLFEALRRWRRELSAKLGIPPFTVFSDATLEELCQVRPSNRAALGGVKGIGDKKADQFGDGALDIITETCRVLNLALDAKAGSRTQTTRRDRPVRGVGGGGDRTAPDASADAIDALGMSSGARAAKPFFDDCMAIGAVCDNLGRKPSTVYGYLAEYIQTMKPRDIDAWVKPDEYQRVAETIRELGPGPLRPIYDRLAAEPQGGLSFDVIRLTMSHMQACRPR